MTTRPPSPAGPAQPAEAAPVPAAPTASGRGPWKFWATVGFTLAIAWGCFAAALAMGFALAFAGVALRIDAFRGGRLPETLESGLFLSLAFPLIGAVAVVLAVGFALLRRGYPLGQYFALRRPTVRQMASWTAVLVVYMAAAEVTIRLAGEPAVPDWQTKAYQTAGFLPLLVFALVVAAPLSEELVFRGFMLEGMRHSRAGPVLAVLITAGVWAAIHTQYGPLGIGTVFVMGLVLGAARLKTGSIWVPVVLHGLNNLVAVIQTAVVAGW
jgi:hypothetical protein